MAGSSVYAATLPVIAALDLDASPGQVSALASAAVAPAFLLALPAGVAGDRYSKKHLMVGTDLAAAGVVTLVPLCWAAGALSMPLVYGVALVLGALTSLHQAAAIALVPEMVEVRLVTEANARVSGAYAVARSLGIYGGSFAAGVVGATRCLLLTSVTYLVSAWHAHRIPSDRIPTREQSPRLRVIAAIREGLAHVGRDPLQRALVLSVTTHAFATGIVSTYVAYYLLTSLHLGSTGLGLVMGTAGVGNLAGAVVTPYLVRRLGPGTVLIVAFIAYPVCVTPLLLARSGPAWLITLVTASTLQAVADTVFATTQRSLRQQLCPAHLQSRVQQTFVWLISGARLGAALTAGAIAAVVGVRATLLIGLVLLLSPVTLLWHSPVRQLTATPDPAAPPQQNRQRQRGGQHVH
ncbi:MFS transporter [Streptomyces sp. A1499]|uniref:MFS transporter n=1 Tax=Streptomyces sp. A1499 TaxID=2563104 RepID=UPI001F0DA875|nr:MFS transporter [Streptomyces sp. A1499]